MRPRIAGLGWVLSYACATNVASLRVLVFTGLGLACSDICYWHNRGILDNSAGGRFLGIEPTKLADVRSFKNSISRGGERHLNFNLGALRWVGSNR